MFWTHRENLSNPVVSTQCSPDPALVVPPKWVKSLVVPHCLLLILYKVCTLAEICETSMHHLKHENIRFQASTTDMEDLNNLDHGKEGTMTCNPVDAP